MPFSAFFPAGKADPTLIGRLTRQSELQGLLRAAVGGLQQVMRRGAFALPPSVIIATERFKNEADPLRAFIEERVRLGPDTFTPRPELYAAYSTWATVNGYHSMSTARFYESVLAAAVDIAHTPITIVTRKGVRGFRGIELR